MISYTLPIENPSFEAALKDSKSDNAEARWVSAICFGRQTGKNAVEAKNALLQLANDKNPHVAAQAMQGLAEFSRKEIIDLSKIVNNALLSPSAVLRWAAVDVSPWLVDNPKDIVLSAVDDEDASVRACAARVAGETGNENLQTRSILDVLMRDKVHFVRTEALIALAVLGEESGIKAMPELAFTKGADSIRAIIAMGETTADTLIKKALEKIGFGLFFPREKKNLALACLARHKNEKAVSMLTGKLLSGNSSKAMAALTAVAQIPSQLLIEPVFNCILIKNEEVASCAIRTLLAIFYKYPAEVRKILACNSKGNMLASCKITKILNGEILDEFLEIYETIKNETI